MRNESLITIKATGGLCNRMRAIDSAIALSSDLGHQKVKIIWEVNNDLGCKLHDLFRPTEKIVVENTRYFSNKDILLALGYYNTYDPKYIENPLKRYIKTICAKEKHYQLKLYANDINNLYREPLEIQPFKESSSTYIATFRRFYPSSNAYQEFKPVAEIESKINTLTTVFNQATIGVHIRRTDNVKSIEHSPLEKFIEVMNKEITRNNNTNFFVATDDPLTENQLKEQFGEKIITYKKSRSRTTKIGMQDAVVDLFALSKCSKIYGSYWSSFSETAAEISDIELIQVLKDE